MNNKEESKAQILNEEVLENVAGGIERTEKHVFESVSSTVENMLGLPKGTVMSSSSFSDLGADSLDVVDIVSIVEKNFHMNFKAEQFVGNSTIEELCNAIISKYKG